MCVCACTHARVLDLCVSVTNAGLNFSAIQRSHCEYNGGLLRLGVSPIVVLTSGRSLLFTVSTDLPQHTGDIWSSPATVNHPDTASLEHILPANTTWTHYNSVSVGVSLAASSLLTELSSEPQGMLGVKQRERGIRGNNTFPIYF